MDIVDLSRFRLLLVTDLGLFIYLKKMKSTLFTTKHFKIQNVEYDTVSVRAAEFDICCN